MKRFLIFLMVSSLVFCLFSGCKSAENEESAAADTVVETEKEDAPAEQDQPQIVPETPQKEEEPPAETPEKTPAEKENTPAETPEETPAPTPEPEEKEEQPAEETIDYSTWIKVASYNIKCLMYGTQLEAVAQELKQIDADIVGFQEVDVDTGRSGMGNQMQMIAEAAGYPYWAFTKLTDFDGGMYGMGIISRYPIKESTDETYKVIASGDHTRKFGRHVLDVNGKELVFYNTHMTLGGTSENGAELKQVTSKMAGDKYAVLTGDMNMVPDYMGRYVNTKKVTVLNGGDDFVFMTNTFPAGKSPKSAIDNIVVTDTLDHYWNDNTNVGIEVSYTDNSDHNLIWTYINFK
ncbi:MAG: endonuclease/exonuclease/phosphatase family protein [Clostridia bacterium]|nr:endonuclease/exonuclease/phosphatase family protein [Clostridia bacterium]